MKRAALATLLVAAGVVGWRKLWQFVEEFEQMVEDMGQ